MKALIYRTSTCDEVSLNSPIMLAERVETGELDYSSYQYKFAWLIDVETIEDLREVAAETGHQLVITFPEERKYGQDLNIEIYDDYRE